MKISAEEVEKRIQISKPYISFDHSTYKNTTTKCKFIDDKYGIWWTTPKSVLSGREHPNRKFRRSSKDIELEIQTTRPYITLDHDTYKNTYTKCRFIDNKYGEFWVKPNDLLNNCSQVHPERTLDNRRISVDEIELKIQKTRPFVSIDKQTYKGVSNKCKFIDSEYGVWYDYPCHLLKHVRKAHPQRNPFSLISVDEIEHRIQITRPFISIDKSTYVNTATKCKFLDSKYGEWFAIPNNVLVKGSVHPDRCTYVGLENLFSEITGFERYNKIPDKLKNTGLLIRPDFQIDENIFVDVHGLYWHSEKRQDKWYHFKRRDVFARHGLRLLQFYEDEITSKPNIVKSIVNNAINKSVRFYARHCEFTDTSSNFFINNHLMGDGKGSYLGLALDGLVLAGLSYKIQNKLLHVNRYCTLAGYSVVGGYTKLLKEIKRITGITRVVNFVDLRYGTGNHLISHGFELVNVHLSYQWTNGRERFNRMQCQANMDHRKLTQTEHAIEKGWFKIYDAGQAKYVSF